MSICAHRVTRLISILFLVSMLLGSAAFAKTNSEITQWGRNINIGPNERAGGLTCFGCNIHVRGQVAGDITTFGGSIALEDHAQVTGDLTAFKGDLRLDEGVQVAGEATVFGGEIRRDPHATVSGDVTAFSGRGWVLLIFLAPLFMVGLLVAFVIWVAQRARRPALEPSSQQPQRAA